MVQEIASLADAIDFLEEWPEDGRNPTHEAALRACQAALDGSKPISAAHTAFVAFAKGTAILEDPISAMQWIAACWAVAR